MLGISDRYNPDMPEQSRYNADTISHSALISSFGRFGTWADIDANETHCYIYPNEHSGSEQQESTGCEAEIAEQRIFPRNWWNAISCSRWFLVWIIIRHIFTSANHEAAKLILCIVPRCFRLTRKWTYGIFPVFGRIWMRMECWSTLSSRNWMQASQLKFNVITDLIK